MPFQRVAANDRANEKSLKIVEDNLPEDGYGAGCGCFLIKTFRAGLRRGQSFIYHEKGTNLKWQEKVTQSTKFWYRVQYSRDVHT